MPEIYFDIEWPDQKVTSHYSPSTIVRDFFTAGETLTTEELRLKSVEALNRASDRVQEKFGYRCTSAEESLRTIMEQIDSYGAGDVVRIAAVG